MGNGYQFCPYLVSWHMPALAASDYPALVSDKKLALAPTCTRCLPVLAPVVGRCLHLWWSYQHLHLLVSCEYLLALTFLWVVTRITDLWNSYHF